MWDAVYCQGEGNIAPVHVRLGMMLSPTPRFAGGIDYTFPHPSLFMMRLDAESIVDANIGRSATVYPVTLDVLLHGDSYDEFFPDLAFGAGVGPYIAQQTRFGGKLFVDLGGRSGGAELGVHFPGRGDLLLTLQLRKAF